MTNETPKCTICGEQMTLSKNTFGFQGYNCPCPKPQLTEPKLMSQADRTTLFSLAPLNKHATAVAGHILALESKVAELQAVLADVEEMNAEETAALVAVAQVVGYTGGCDGLANAVRLKLTAERVHAERETAEADARKAKVQDAECERDKETQRCKLAAQIDDDFARALAAEAMVTELQAALAAKRGRVERAEHLMHNLLVAIHQDGGLATITTNVGASGSTIHVERPWLPEILVSDHVGRAPLTAKESK